MTIHVLDTDHLSLYGRAHPVVSARLLAARTRLTTTAINLEEQFKGRLAQIAETSDETRRSIAYQRLTETLLLLSEFTILPYDEKSRGVYQSLKTQRLRVGTQDLRIASIVIAHNGILLTRNLRDFQRIPGLISQDWSIEPSS